MSWGAQKLGNVLATSGYDRGGSNDYPVLSITMNEGLVDQSAKFKKRVASIDTSSYRVVYANELVVGFPIDEGVLGFQTRYPAALVSPAYGVWKLRNPTETHIPFVQGYLRSSEARGIYASKMRGAVARRRSITREDFLDIEIPFPPLDEQKRIAVVLEKVDALRRQRQESLQLTEKLLQSVFIEKFGNPATNPKAWEPKELSTLGTLDRGVSKHRPRNAPELLGGKYPLIQTGEVSNAGLYIRGFKHTYSEIGFKQSKLWPKGTLCITIAANIARTGILDFDACFPDSVVGFTPHEGVSSSIYIHFLFGFLQAMLEKNAPQAAQKNINLAILRKLRVPAPPYSLQEDFERIVCKAVVVTEDQKDSLKMAARAFASIQQRAFGGELDVSQLKLDTDEPTSIPPVTQIRTPDGRTYYRPGSFIAPPEIEVEMLALEEKFDQAPAESRPWSENYFKYRTLSQALLPPFSFAEIWEATVLDMEEASYETVKDKVFEYVAAGILEQQFHQTRKEIVFYPRP
jgi:type I restriction enzyme S subunit